MHTSGFEREIQRRWRRIQRRCRLQDAKRLAIAVVADETRATQVGASTSILQRWVAHFDEGFAALYLLFYQSHHQRFEVKAGNGAFLFLLGRSLNLVSAIRHLAVGGFDQAARPLVRSLVENLDLAIAVLHDEGLAEQFVATGDDQEAARKFWHRVVARGGLHRRVEHVANALSFGQPEAAWFVRHRQESAATLSRSVHASYNAAFLSTFVPSIHTPGQLILGPLGEVSIHTPMLLDFVTKELHLFTALALRLITSKPPPELFQSVNVNTVLFQSMAASILLLEELVVTHSEDIDEYRSGISFAESAVPQEPGA